MRKILFGFLALGSILAVLLIIHRKRELGDGIAVARPFAGSHSVLSASKQSKSQGNLGTGASRTEEVNSEAIASAIPGEIEFQNRDASASALGTTRKRPAASPISTSSHDRAAGGGVRPSTNSGGLDAVIRKRLASFFDTAPVPLTDEQRAAVIAIRLDEAQISTIALRGDIQSQTVFDATERAHEDAQAKLRQILPEEDMKALAEYDDSSMARGLASKFVENSRQNGVTIAPEDLVALTAVLNRTKVSYSPTMHDVSADQFKALTSFDQKAITEAAAILKPDELAILQQTLANRFRVVQR